MSGAFELTDLCIAVDGRAFRQPVSTDLVAGLARHISLDAPARLATRIDHVVGTHTLEGATLARGTLTAHAVEIGSGPAEERPTIRWSFTPAASPSSEAGAD
jgi:hypothetical protein